MTPNNKVYFFKAEGVSKEKQSLFAKKFLCKKAGLEPNTVFAIAEHGKPYLQEKPQFHFNISHCKGALAIVISATPVGVDCENIRPADLRLTSRFFTSEECDFAADDESFFYVWTRKEAFIKQNGKGLSLGLNTFNSLEMTNIITKKIGDIIISVCNDNAHRFDFIEENFQWQI